MRPDRIVHRIVRGLTIALMATAAFALFSFFVMWLWNWLMPAVFGWHQITFWQALGLLVLSKILFGGFRGGWGHRGRWGRGMQERWEQMTPEQREKFRKGMAGCMWSRPGSEARGGAGPGDAAHAPETGH
jgi:hypothetical protein